MSGTAISIGHTTSETTVNDNLTKRYIFDSKWHNYNSRQYNHKRSEHPTAEGSTTNDHETTLTTV